MIARGILRSPRQRLSCHERVRRRRKHARPRVESLEQRRLLAAEVALSVDINSGSETAMTVVALTATADQPVTGLQTVDIEVTGTRITSGDYSLSSPQITIADSGTQGTATFTILDDAEFEGPETATITITNPSPGLTIGPTGSHEVGIADNDPLDQAIDDVLNQTVARQTQGLQAQLANTFPASNPMWFHEDFALAAYWLNQQTSQADAGLISLIDDGHYQATVAADSFHWHAYLLERIYFLYSSQSDFPQFQGRMSTAAEDAVLQMLWDWAAPISEIGLASPDKLNFYWGSENHDAQAWVSLWGASQIFKDHSDYQNRTYGDGSTPAAMAAAFDDYFKAYVRSYTLKGLPIEIASPTYAKYTLNTWLNLFDFAEDPELKEATGMLLDVYWADWNLEQIDGVRGGSRHRSYPGRSSISTGAASHAWYLFGKGIEASKHPGAMSAATTSWRPSRAVVALALDEVGRGSYQYTSRRLGLKDQAPPTEPPAFHGGAYNPVDPDGGSLLRTTWSTPDFVMGMSQVEARPHEDWTAISSQNRWNGVVFSGHETARIFTQRPKPARGSVYNAEWGVQEKGAMILQRLSQAHSATGQMIWFDFSLNREETNGWIFAEAADAFAAVRVVHGGFTWQPDTDVTVGEWAVLNEQFSPIILEVGRKQEYADFDAFKAEIQSNGLEWNGTRLDYTSAGYGTTLTHFADESAPPQVDGVPLDFSTSKAYDSPYLQGDFGSGTVTIDYGNDRTVLGVAPFANYSDTIALWHLDQEQSDANGTFYADDTTAATRDSIEAREHGQGSDSISVISDGKFGSAVRFDFEAGDQYMITGSELWPADVGTFRFQGWIRLRSGDTAGYLAHVYDQVYLSVNNSTATFAINRSGDTSDTSPTNYVSVSAGLNPTDQWQYIDAMYDGSTIKLCTDIESVSGGGIGPFVPDRRNIYIGSRKNKSNFVGDMDEVRLSAPDVALDFGDAPSETLRSVDGARHAAQGPRLGSKRDTERDGQPSVGADGDGSDEDGVMFGTIGIGSALAGVNIDLQNAADARVDAWLDFDGDGIWQADEKILDDILVSEVPGFQTLNFSVNADAVAGDTYARLRISSAGNLEHNGLATDGEVEDYLVTLHGDAAPTVEDVSINGGQVQRSVLTEVVVTFDSEVSTPPSAFQIKHRGRGEVLDTLIVNSIVNGEGKTVTTLTFGDGGNLVDDRPNGGNSLIDGNYQLTINRLQVAKVGSGPNMVSDYNLGDEEADNFFRFFTDQDGDRDADATDLVRFGATFRKNSGDLEFNPLFDGDGDNDVDATDLIAFGRRFRGSMPFA